MFKITAYASIILTVSGCSTFQKQAAVHPVSIVEAKLDFCSKLTEKYRKSKKAALSDFAFTSQCGELSKGSGGARDLLLNLMSIGDQVCARELAVLSANQRTVNATLSTASTTFSSVATILTGGLADTILSSGATITGSARDHINAEVYKTDNPSAIIRLVQAHRKSLSLAILENWNVKAGGSATTKTAQDALRDANRYHHSCSLYNGLALVTAAVDSKTLEIEKENADKENPQGGEVAEKKKEEPPST